jgi:50S ribosomal protein L16 3-hydroxylase
MKKTSANLTLLGGLTPEQFFSEYWHKKPLLIRQAIPDFTPLLSAEELFELAGRDDVESRLISFFKQHWEMKSGPIAPLPLKEKKDWTLLVQGVNLHHRKADALLRQFRFIPDARLDDLMISFAKDGGGVGPHFDSYDVFLLQAHGQRRWRIGAQKDLSLIKGMPLKILSNCMTYSIGFRAPSFQELGESFLQFMSDSIDLPGRYADPELTSSAHPGEISQSMLSTISAELKKIKFTKDDMTIFLGEHLTEPKSSVFFTSPKKNLTPKKFALSAQKTGVALSLKTQMLYKGENIFINGESFSVSKGDQLSLHKLANQRYLDGADISSISADVMEAFCIWYEDGWLELSSEEDK